MSTKVTYDPDDLTLERLSGSTWVALDVAVITVTAGYDISETGVLLVTPDTCEFTVSRYVDEPIVPLPVGTLIRVRLTQPGADELYSGLITDVTIDYTAEAGVDWRGRPWRADHRVSTTGLAASRMAVTRSWKKLPAETVSARLGRWISVVDLGTATDALLPPETTAGSTTLLEMVRAASDYCGRPFRLINNGSDTEVHAVTASTALPSRFHDGDALDMFTRATDQTTAGDRTVSFDAGDVTRTVSGDLAPDDVRLLHSGWRIPERLPAPFNEAGAVCGFSMTFTPNGCSGWIQYAYDTPRKLRYRPARHYVPGDPDTTKPAPSTGTGTDTKHAYLLAYTEIAATAETGDTGSGSTVGQVLAPSTSGNWTYTFLPIYFAGEYRIPFHAKTTGNTSTEFTTLWYEWDLADGTHFETGGVAYPDGLYGASNPQEIGVPPTATRMKLGFVRGVNSSGTYNYAEAEAAADARGWIPLSQATDVPVTQTYDHHYGDVYAIGGHTIALDNLRLNGDHLEIDYTLDAALISPQYLTVYLSNHNTPDAGGVLPHGIGTFHDLEASSPATGTLAFVNGSVLYQGDTDPLDYYVSTVLREHEHGFILSTFDSVGPATISEPTYVVPVVSLDGQPMDVVGSTLTPPAIAAYFAESVAVAGDYTLASPAAAALTSIQTPGIVNTSVFQIITGTGGTVARTIDVHSGDTVFVYVSTIGTTEPDVTCSSQSLPLERDQGQSTDTTAFVLYTGTADADGSFVVSANGEGDLSMSIGVIS